MYKKINRVTMVGALPPLKGNAYYCMGLALNMAKKIHVDFLAFRKLYPEFLYPGGVVDRDPKFAISENQNLKIHRVLHYANPFSWVRSALFAKSALVHLQWWSVPLAVVYLVMLSILRFRHKTIIMTVHNVVPHEAAWINRFVTRSILYFADGVIVHSRDNRVGLREHFNFPNERIFEVPMPVHNMYGDEDMSVDWARQSIGIPRTALVILSFGNLRDYKGVDTLIRAFEKVRKSLPQAHLLIVGQPWSGWHVCDELIDELEIRHDVTTVLKYVEMSSVAKYFVSSDIVVLPYRRFDAQSGVGNIALFYELPLVVTRVGGLPELVRDKGVVVEPDDPAALAATLVRVLSGRQLYQKLQRDSTALKEKYSWEAAISETLKIYSVVTRRGQSKGVVRET